MTLPSRYSIGEPVSVHFHGGENDGVELKGYVRAALFTASKVRYSIVVGTGALPDGQGIAPEELQSRLEGNEPEQETKCWFTLHNIDSVLVYPREGESIDLSGDNYS